MAYQELISAGVLNTYWDNKHADMLDLMMPFLKYSIAQTTSVGRTIDLSALTNYFRKEYGYDDIPIAVIRLMLNRLSPNYLKKGAKQYILVKSLAQDVKDYEKKKLQYKERINNVILGLQDHLNKTIEGKNYSYVQVGNFLYDFFVQNGLKMGRSTDALSEIKSRDGKVNYEIARFILSENKKRSILFDYILEMVQGFFMSTAIALQSPTAATLKGKIKKCNCYIDTRVLIDALGLHTDAAKQCALELLDMLRGSGARLKCFTHNFDEISDVIDAYKRDLSNPKDSSSLNTLEFFDEHGYSIEDVSRYRSLLRGKIEKLGVVVEDEPGFDPTLMNEDALIDEAGLEELLLSDSHHWNKKTIRHAVEVDVQSASSIMRLRNGEKPTELEKCGYIFVTSNIRFCQNVSKFLNQRNGEVIPAVISDINLSAIMWLKNYKMHKYYPRSRLLKTP